MKKLNLFIAVAIMAALFVACGQTDLQKAESERDAAYERLEKKGNELRPKLVAGGYNAELVNENFNVYKQYDINAGRPTGTRAYYYELMARTWLNTAKADLEAIGAYELVQEIKVLADEVLALEAKVKELGGNNDKYLF